MKEKKVLKLPQVLTKKLLKVGGSNVVVVPDDWLEQHNLKKGDRITMIMNAGLKILTPKQAEQYYDKLHDIVEEPIK